MRPIQKGTKSKKGWDMAQVLENLLSKGEGESLISNSLTTHTQKERKKAQ
jgi:hypothetical protein